MRPVGPALIALLSGCLASEASSIRLAEPPSIQEIVDRIPDDPSAAADHLRASDDRYARGWLAFLAFLGHIEGVPPGPGAQVDAWMAETKSSPESTSIVEDGHYRTLEEVLFDIRFVTSDVNAPCWLFEAHPDAAFRAFGPYWGSSQDIGPGFCRLDFQETPEWRTLVEAMTTLSLEYLRTTNDWLQDRTQIPHCGTIRFSNARGAALDLLRSALFPSESLEPTPETLKRRARYAEWVAGDATGLRAQMLADLERARAAMRPALVAWFETRAGDAERAGPLADRWLDLQQDLLYAEDARCLGE